MMVQRSFCVKRRKFGAATLTGVPIDM
jgi:hypothetical protein